MALINQNRLVEKKYFNGTFWIVLGLSLLLHLSLCYFFSFGEYVPHSNDINVCNLWRNNYSFPPQDSFSLLYWMGERIPANPINLFTLLGDVPPWFFFTMYPAVMAGLAFIAMYLLIRELGLSRNCALFAGITVAWQGDIVPFTFPGHFGYMALWSGLGVGVWATLRAIRTGQWPYMVLSGLCCAWMVEPVPDRGAIASVFIASIYLVAAGKYWFQNGQSFTSTEPLRPLIQLGICTAVALIVASSSLFSFFDLYGEGTTLGGATTPEESFELSTQYRLGPCETLTLAVPGFYGWISTNDIPGDNNPRPAPYWGEIGRTANYDLDPRTGVRNLNYGISTLGTIGSIFAVFGIFIVSFGHRFRLLTLAKHPFTADQLTWARFFALASLVTLILSWGAETPFYKFIYFHVPLMDKWRNPLKWLEITTFCLPILSAYGLQYVLLSFQFRGMRGGLLRRVIRSYVGGVTVAFFGWYWFSFHWAEKLVTPIDGSAPFFAKMGYVPTQIHDIVTDIYGSLANALILSAFIWAMLEVLWRPRWLRNREWINPIIQDAWVVMLQARSLPTTFTLFATLFSVIQLYWVANHFIFPDKLHQLIGRNDLLQALINMGPTSRISIDRQDPLLYNYSQFQFSKFRIPCLEPQAVSRTPVDWDDFEKALSKDEKRYLFLTGVNALVFPSNILEDVANNPAYKDNMSGAPLGYDVVPDADQHTPSHTVLHLRAYLPKASFIPAGELLKDRATLMTRMDDPTWDPTRSVLFEKEVPTSPPTAFPLEKPAPLPLVTILNYTDTRIIVSVDNPRPGYVLIDDAFDSGWHAQINHQSVPIYKADLMMRAIPITHQADNVIIDMNYDPTVKILDISKEYYNIACDGLAISLTLLSMMALCVSPRPEDG